MHRRGHHTTITLFYAKPIKVFRQAFFSKRPRWLLDILINIGQVQQNLGCLIHSLYRDAFARAMVVKAAGAKVRAGQAHVRQGRAVRAAANGRFQRLQANLADGGAA